MKIKNNFPLSLFNYQFILQFTLMMSIFSKIIAWDIPSTKIYEDDLCIAILDISPVNKGHILLISKEELPWMTDASDELIAHMYIKANTLMKTMKEKLECDFVRLYVEGTEVPHFHIHLIPSWHDDGKVWLMREKYEDGEAEEFGEKLS